MYIQFNHISDSAPYSVFSHIGVIPPIHISIRISYFWPERQFPHITADWIPCVDRR